MIPLLLLLNTIPAVEWYAQGVAQRNDRDAAQAAFLQAARSATDEQVAGIPDSGLALLRARSYFLAGDLAQSIAAYHAGLANDPHDDDLREGLREARQQVVYPDSGMLRAECRLADKLGISHQIRDKLTYQVIAMACFLVGWLVLARAWITRGRVWWVLGASLIIVSGTMLLFRWRDDRQFAWQMIRPVVVVAELGTVLYAGNSPDYPRVFREDLPLGVELTIVSERGRWLMVKTAGGTVGWLPRAQIVSVDR